MRAHMRNQVAGRRERLVARLANMWLLPRMRAHVRSQAAKRRERLVARLADMWRLPCMRAHMRRQVAGLSERLVARLADMLLLYRMRQHVHCQKACVRACLAALYVGTFVILFVLLPKRRPHAEEPWSGVGLSQRRFCIDNEMREKIITMWHVDSSVPVHYVKNWSNQPVVYPNLAGHDTGHLYKIGQLGNLRRILSTRAE